MKELKVHITVKPVEPRSTNTEPTMFKYTLEAEGSYEAIRWLENKIMAIFMSLKRG